MKCIYEASDILEAHVIQGLLEQHRISSFIEGEHLLGAVGELPASRLVRILVNDDDLAQGSSLMRDYDSNNHPLNNQATIAEGGMPRHGNTLLIAMALMIVMILVESLRHFF
jgi:prolipoprotein diacylglyceryltransferase